MNDAKRCQEHDLDALWIVGDLTYARRDDVVVGLRTVGGGDDIAEYLDRALADAGAPAVSGRVRDWATCAAACRAAYRPSHEVVVLVNGERRRALFLGFVTVVAGVRCVVRYDGGDGSTADVAADQLVFAGPIGGES